MASSQKVINTRRGQEMEGEIVLITDSELILDLGTKSEGVIQKREFPASAIEKLKIGDKVKAFVIFNENENGQVVLSLHQAQPKSGGRHGREINWSRFKNAQTQKSKLSGRVTEINKGGLIVEVDGVRGFLPNSQVGFELLSKAGKGMEDLVGQTINITVSEIDQDNNKLIFSQRGQVSAEVKAKLAEFKKDTKEQGKIVAVLPFGLVVNVKGSEGLVFISDVSWEKQEDLTKGFKVGEEIEVLVTGIDEDLGRLNLSIKQLSEDPFGKLTDKYPPDQVVKGKIIGDSESGVAVLLEDPSGELGTSGIEGFLPAAKMGGTSYEVGQTVSFLVDSVDTQRRKINLAPFVTTTQGLIYK